MPLFIPFTGPGSAAGAGQQQAGPPRAARFSRDQARGLLLAALHKAAPALAAACAYGLLARPPRPRDTAPQAAVRRLAHPTRLRHGSLDLALQAWGTGPTVLLVHGWGGHALQFSALVQPLVQADLRVLAFDAPAHGRSRGRQVDLVAQAAAIAIVARQAGPLHCVLGHGAGAAAALHAVRDWGFDAGRLVLLGAPAHADWPLHAFARRMGLPAETVEHMRCIAERRHNHRLNWSRLWLADLLRQAALPTLLVHDEGDDEVPFAQGMSLARAWPEAQVHATCGLGHHRLLDSPGVVDRIVQFVSPTAPALRPTPCSATSLPSPD